MRGLSNRFVKARARAVGRHDAADRAPPAIVARPSTTGLHATGLLATGLVAAALLAGCADDATTGTTGTAAASTNAASGQPVENAAASAAARPAASAPPGAAATSSTGASTDQDLAAAGPSPVQQNDPSAPPDTPLCGRAARERIALAAAIEPDVAAGAGACAQTACFDPATDTYIGADGYRHVCQ